jgi:hypothetical protein
MNNPLTKFYRVPKIYAKLPTRGRFYPPNMIETSANQELAVYGLSAVDQILLKTPDAMLNGDSLIQVIKNCVPGVKDVKMLVEPDINTLLLAIRIATTGAKIDQDLECPNCKKNQTFEVDVSSFLETQSYILEDPKVMVNDDLVVTVRPFDFEQRNLAMINEIEESQAVKLLQGKEDLSTEQQAQQVAAIVAKMTDTLFELMAKSVISVMITSTGEVVTDPSHILEFVKGINKTQADAIGDKIKELNQIGVDTTSRFQCDSCNHTWEQKLDFDPISFFD